MTYLNILRVLVIIISFIGCCIQLYTLTEEYMRMEVIQDLEMTSTETVKIPDVTLSTFALNFIDYTKLKVKYPEKAKKLNDSYGINGDNFVRSFKDAKLLLAIRDVLSYNFTTKDFLKVIYNIREFMEVAILPSIQDNFPISNRTVIRKVCNTKPYLKGMDIYLTTSCYSKDENQFNAEDILQRSTALIGIVLSPRIFQRLTYLNVYLHTPKTLIRGLRWSEVAIPSSRLIKTYALSYKRSYSQLMPPPYETNCRDYSKDGFESRQHAIEDCQNRHSLKKLGVIFPQNIRLMRTNAFLTDSEKYALQINETVKQIRKQCEEENDQQDCIQEVFTPQFYPGVTLPLNLALIAVKVSGELDVIKTTRPKTSFVEYITLAFSVVGFWFGFSITGSLIVALSIASNKDLIKQLKSKPRQVLKGSVQRKSMNSEINDGYETNNEVYMKPRSQRNNRV